MAQRRPHEIKVRLSDVELALIEARLTSTGCVTKADYLRRCATNAMPQPNTRDAEIAEALGRIGYSLNHLGPSRARDYRALVQEVNELTRAIYAWAGF
ncbi:plasmid mobilization protein [Thioclava sp.]|uniref:plasmid mobilization protein n=1 Tax=Thioclava sp. TaxID=1933450 RepID=UPI003AA8B446